MTSYVVVLVARSPVLVVALHLGPLVVGLLRLGGRPVFGLVLAGFAVAVGVQRGLLVGLQQLHVAVHLPRARFSTAPPSDSASWDLLVAQLLAADRARWMQCSALRFLGRRQPPADLS